MSRSKNLHIVKEQIFITQPDDSREYIADGVIDVALKLSQKYGRQIRQGQSFRLVGWGCSAKPEDDTGGVQDFDMGFAGETTLAFQEPTKHYVKAWNQLLKIWQNQKKLMGRVGRFVRYDDFEVAYSDSYATSRTSTIYDNPIDDSSGDKHQLVLTGNSDDSNDYTSLVSYYNGRFEALPASETQYGTVIKAAKFDTARPLNTTGVRLSAPFQASAMMQEVGVGDDYFGGMSQAGMTFLPSDNHLNVMCGLVNYAIKAWPPDTLTQTADTMELTLTLVFEGWSPLAN